MLRTAALAATLLVMPAFLPAQAQTTGLQLKAPKPIVNVQQNDAVVELNEAEPVVTVERSEPNVVIEQDEAQVNVERGEPIIKVVRIGKDGKPID